MLQLSAPRSPSPSEARPSAPYFTNLDRPVFALDQSAGDGQGRAVRALLAIAEVAAPAVSRRVRRADDAAAAPAAGGAGVGQSSAPSGSTSACSTTTATIRWRSSAACTWPSRTRRTS